MYSIDQQQLATHQIIVHSHLNFIFMFAMLRSSMLSLSSSFHVLNFIKILFYALLKSFNFSFNNFVFVAGSVHVACGGEENGAFSHFPYIHFSSVAFFSSFLVRFVRLREKNVAWDFSLFHSLFLSLSACRLSALRFVFPRVEQHCVYGRGSEGEEGRSRKLFDITKLHFSAPFSLSLFTHKENSTLTTRKTNENSTLKWKSSPIYPFSSSFRIHIVHGPSKHAHFCCFNIKKREERLLRGENFNKTWRVSITLAVVQRNSADGITSLIAAGAEDVRSDAKSRNEFESN